MKTRENSLLSLWRERVEGQHIFRGMSAKDVRDPLDPAHDPFAPVRGKLYELVAVLERVVSAGFELTLVEEHFGRKYEHSLRNILAWTKNDLDNPGIDFTSSYRDACEYADCFQGSQLKQNVKFIADHLPARKDDPVISAHMNAGDWALIKEAGTWVSQEAPEHRSVVLWVPRSSTAFDGSSSRFGALPVGSYDGFTDRMQEVLSEKELPLTAESAECVLPSEEDGFTVRLLQPLKLAQVERIEEVTQEKALGAAGPRGVG